MLSANGILRKNSVLSLCPSLLSLSFSPFDDAGEESISPVLSRKSPKQAVRPNQGLYRRGSL